MVDREDHDVGLIAAHNTLLLSNNAPRAEPPEIGTSRAALDSLNEGMNFAYQMTAAGVLIALVTGAPMGWLVWSRTHNRSAALGIGLLVAAAAVVVAAWLYYTRVLCPPGAGCV